MHILLAALLLLTQAFATPHARTIIVGVPGYANAPEAYASLPNATNHCLAIRGILKRESPLALCTTELTEKEAILKATTVFIQNPEDTTPVAIFWRGLALSGPSLAASDTKIYEPPNGSEISLSTLSDTLARAAPNAVRAIITNTAPGETTDEFLIPDGHEDINIPGALVLHITARGEGITEETTRNATMDCWLNAGDSITADGNLQANEYAYCISRALPSSTLHFIGNWREQTLTGPITPPPPPPPPEVIEDDPPEIKTRRITHSAVKPVTISIGTASFIAAGTLTAIAELERLRLIDANASYGSFRETKEAAARYDRMRFASYYLFATSGVTLSLGTTSIIVSARQARIKKAF